MKVSIPDSRGQKLSALIDAPESSKPSPLVILLHGNTGWKEEVHLQALAIQLAGEGITAIRFDAPGSGESYGSWGAEYRASNYIDAVNTVYEWALKNLDVIDSKVALWGHSMGGMVAVQVATKWPHAYAALCGSQPSTGVAPSSDGWEQAGGKEVETEIFGTVWLPKEFFEDRLQYSTIEAVKLLTIPQLYIAGTDDDLVPADAVRAIYRSANDPKRYEEFATTHMYKEDTLMMLEINNLTTVFFKEILL